MKENAMKKNLEDFLSELTEDMTEDDQNTSHLSELSEEELSALLKKLKIYIFLVYMTAPISGIIIFLLRLIDINRWYILGFIILSLIIQLLVIFNLRNYSKYLKDQNIIE